MTTTHTVTFERWVRERASQSNSGGWVPETWTEELTLPQIEAARERLALDVLGRTKIIGVSE